MHRQKTPDTSISTLNKRMRIVNPASIAVERMSFLFRQNGFYPIFSPSLETAAGINHKKVQFDREDIKNVDNSNYPLMLYNRTPLVKSQRISGERIFEAVGPRNSLINTTHGEFTLRMAAVFNSMEQLEEFETSYLICGINSESLNIHATLPPVGILESLSPEDRSFILDLEWKDPSELQIERNNGRYEFSVGNTVTILTSYFNISDPDTIRALSTAQLNFYWDEELYNKESEWEINKYDQIHVIYHTNEDSKISYPYAKELDPEYEKTDFKNTEITLIGYEPYDNKKIELDPDNLKYGSSISEIIYSYSLNSDKYILSGVTLSDINGDIHKNIESSYSTIFGRSYINVNNDLSYSLSVDDKYSQNLSKITVEIPIQYPIFFGMIDDTSTLVKRISNSISSGDLFWSDKIRLSYGSSEGGYFYYAFPSKFGRIGNAVFIPSNDNADLRLMSINNFLLRSGKKSSRSLNEYFIYVSRERIDESFSILIS